MMIVKTDIYVLFHLRALQGYLETDIGETVSVCFVLFCFLTEVLLYPPESLIIIFNHHLSFVTTLVYAIIW